MNFKIEPLNNLPHAYSMSEALTNAPKKVTFVPKMGT